MPIEGEELEGEEIIEGMDRRMWLLIPIVCPLHYILGFSNIFYENVIFVYL